MNGRGSAGSAYALRPFFNLRNPKVRTFLLLLSLLFSLAGTVVSCMRDEEYTLSPTDVLSFSADTIAFDTVISGSPTNTYTFTVYNRASKAIRIPTVRLAAGASSPFKVNVDGTPLADGTATDFEIAARDSMIVYLMANVPQADTDEPVPVSDKLLFTTESGVEQEVVLKAAGQAVEEMRGVRISQDAVLNLHRPYRIMDSLVVEAGATLSIEAGVRLYFHPQAMLIVHGTLLVNGTVDSPVLFRGDRLGNMFAGQPYDRIPGQWGGIRFSGESYGNDLRYADIHSSAYGVRVDSSDVQRLKLNIENCILHNSTQNALDIRMAQVKVGNTQITNAGADCVHVRGGDVSFVHCTIARFYVFTGGSGTALNFANHDGDTRLPLTRMQFTNCIVTGYQSDEVMGSQNEAHADAFDYAFSNCLLNTPPVEDDGHIVNCLYDVDDGAGTDEEGRAIVRERNFTPLPDLDALTFSFALAKGSKAIGHADASVSASTFPKDRLGRPRGAEPDMGCYQHVEQPAPTAPNGR